MFVLHVALQGCLRSHNVEYGLTPDTGGHIRYLLDLVRASAAEGAAKRIVVATRAFASRYGDDYAVPSERVDARTEIVRFPTANSGYLPKEELWRETESFAERLIEWIEAQPDRPDFLHAHYADAATVAAIVKRQLGIPFLFTGHSLGRVKAEAMGVGSGGAEPFPGFSHRIAAEEGALREADLVIASSRDEAEVQYAGYRAYDPGRIRILPPGSDLQHLSGAASCPDFEASVARFLTDPGKPVLLALARPVAKKNLRALVQAFGESPALREKANLLVVAGCRDDLADLDEESGATMRAILDLVDRYDLYGSVAYPKQHRPEDVAAIYAYARARRGVFVNPALNEPFGLTLLEASAAGLPLVATDSGGPNDIIEMCGNGELVDPRSTGAIAAAALRILNDPVLWDRYSAAGAKAVAAYDWAKHAARYHGLLAALKQRRAPSRFLRQLLVSDIDNTLVGCNDGVRSFTDWQRLQGDLAFGVATGRSFHSAMAILEQWDAPRPRVMITSVGSEIYHLQPNGTTYAADRNWEAIVREGWNREAVRAVMETVPGIRPQAPLEQRRFKLSYFTDGDRHVARDVRERLERAGLLCSVIHSHGRYLDILPVSASKGTAVDYVRHLLGLPESAVFVAGDSGNDIEMLRTARQAIIVGNFSDDLASHPELTHSYVARQTHARGIIEGVDHFRRMAAATSPAWPATAS
ncbi:HAD-IIB family hydrolase [Aureimonas leprariae]|uniref:sucrose-phosphate synthase n=1 Tax=Plantimonas leprariae TaxID=2615207 RepID=A0A7V7PSQ5_9HYPH|nr:HAD-IIB family hydrolase [Aureimonas leprariae]KAB0682630.1 HAD-IIB family hydrolase [Aureimonas leprariae]